MVCSMTQRKNWKFVIVYGVLEVCYLNYSALNRQLVMCKFRMLYFPKIKIPCGFPINKNRLSINEVEWVQTSTTTVSYVLSHIGLFV